MAKKPDTAGRKAADPNPYLTRIASDRRSRRQRQFANIDDIIVSLADSHENQRARQVGEWVRQQSVRRAA